METLNHPRDSKWLALAPLIAIVLVYVLVAAAMLGNVMQNAPTSTAGAFVAPEITIQA